MPAHRKANCGICKRPLSGDNLYVDPKGRRGCKNCRARNNAASKARQRDRKLAALRVKAKATRKDADRFAALVAAIRAELVTMTAEQRARYLFPPPCEVTRAERAAGAFAGRRVTRGQVGALTGLGDDGGSSTVSQYLRRAQRAHAAGQVTAVTMPLRAADGTWRLGDLALWRAAVWPKHSLGNPGRWDTGTDEQALPVIEQAIAEGGRGTPVAEIREALAEAGLSGRANVGTDRIGRLVREKELKAVRPGTPQGPQPAALESLRWDGLVTTAQLAGAFECSRTTVWDAVRAGQLTPALRERGMLFDPARVAARRDGKPGPVDAGHALALKPDML